MRHILIRRAGVQLLLLFVAACSAHAASIVVTSPADPGITADGQCTLREALANANANADLTAGDCAAGTGDDSITFAASVGATITLAALPNNPLQITDASGSLFIQGPGADRFEIAASGGAIMQIGTVVGGLANATIEGLTLRNGTSIQGGAIRNFGTLTLRRSVVRDSGPIQDEGGGIYNTGTLSIIESTVANNGPREVGGGIQNVGTLTVMNSTISGNRTNGPGGGGGIHNGGAGVVTLFNTTITANVANQGVPPYESRGGGIEHTGANFTIINSLIAGNSAPAFPENADCSGPIVSLGYNLVGLGCPTSGPGDRFIASQDVATYIGPLTNNGGSTPTHALLAVTGNPAVDAGDPGGCRGPDGAALGTDQRGSPRPSNARCDIGAYELQQSFPFTGFFPASAPPPTLNLRIAGGPVVIGFSPGGDRGLNIFAAGSPSSRRIDCTTRAPIGAAEPTTTVSNISLQYVSQSDSYVYLWRTNRSWANTCREFDMTLVDRTTHVALFRFK